MLCDRSWRPVMPVQASSSSKQQAAASKQQQASKQQAEGSNQQASSSSKQQAAAASKQQQASRSSKQAAAASKQASYVQLSRRPLFYPNSHVSCPHALVSANRIGSQCQHPYKYPRPARTLRPPAATATPALQPRLRLGLKDCGSSGCCLPATHPRHLQPRLVVETTTRLRVHEG